MTFCGYNCYWIQESEQDGTKEKILYSPYLEERTSDLLYVGNRSGRDVMDVYISNSSSDQLVVECSHCTFTRFLIIFPPLMFFFIGICFKEDFLSIMKVVLILFAALKLLVHLFFVIDKNRLINHLKDFLKEEPIQSVSSWKLTF